MKKSLILMIAGLSLLVIVAGCAPSQAPAPAATTDVTNRVAALEKWKDTQDKSINPGLGTVMIEYSQRMAKLWYAAQAKNWNLAHYEILEMREIQETGEVTRPNFAQSLKGFESAYLDPLDQAAQKNDLSAFNTAYDKAVDGCNGCHMATSSKDFPNYKFVKFVKPSAPPINYQDWAGNK